MGQAVVGSPDLCVTVSGNLYVNSPSRILEEYKFLMDSPTGNLFTLTFIFAVRPFQKQFREF